MELTENTKKQKQITFDRSDLPGEELGSLRRAFERGSASFGNELHDSIARTMDGISENGELNMDLLSMVEQIIEKIEGHQTEPIVIARLTKDIDRDKLMRVDASVAVLGEDESLVDLSSKLACEPTIHVGGEWYVMSAINDHRLRIERVIPMGNADMLFSAGERPLSDEREHKNFVSTTEILVGDEIIPWVKERFSSDDEGYEIFSGLLRVLKNTGAETFLKDETFEKMFVKERQATRMARTVLIDLNQTTNDLRAMIEGKEAEVNLRLKEISEFAGNVGFRLERLRNEDGSVLDRFGTGEPVPSPMDRVEIIDWQLKTYLDPGKLDIRAAEREL